MPADRRVLVGLAGGACRHPRRGGGGRVTFAVAGGALLLVLIAATRALSTTSLTPAFELAPAVR